MTLIDQLAAFPGRQPVLAAGDYEHLVRNEHFVLKYFSSAFQCRSRGGCGVCVHTCVALIGLLFRLTRHRSSAATAPGRGKQRGWISEPPVGGEVPL